MRTEATEAFTARLLEALPHLRPRYDAAAAECRAEGVEDAATEIFLDHHLRDLVARFRRDPGGARGELEALAGVLEREYGLDDDVDSLVGGLLALLGPQGADADPAAVLGPKLRALVDGRRSWRPRPADEALVGRLVEAVPALVPLAREEGYGEEGVLVHPFLSEVARREAENVASGRLDEVRAVLEMLESEYGTGDVDGPIAVGFVEMLPYPGEPGVAIVDLLGPKLRGELARQRPSLFGG
jgi:hypothetical protein